MDNALLVQMSQTSAGFTDNQRDLRLGELASADNLCQIFTIDELHSHPKNTLQQVRVNVLDDGVVGTELHQGHFVHQNTLVDLLGHNDLLHSDLTASGNLCCNVH